MDVRAMVVAFGWLIAIEGDAADTPHQRRFEKGEAS
jgi:hypothetical protein